MNNNLQTFWSGLSGYIHATWYQWRSEQVAKGLETLLDMIESDDPIVPLLIQTMMTLRNRNGSNQ